jgi:uncharacterized membrane protein HdeD (DUF308 family)
MANATQVAPDKRVESSSNQLRSIWVILIVMGIVLMLVGAMAIGSSYVATLATLLVFGSLLLVGAVFQIVTAFFGRSWRGFFLHLLLGILYLVTGVFIIKNPLEAALTLTVLLAISLLAGGVLRIALALIQRFSGWGWMILNGVVSILLAAAIWRGWPISGLEFIGLIVGIEMMFCGFSWTMLGLTARLAPKAAATA